MYHSIRKDVLMNHTFLLHFPFVWSGCQTGWHTNAKRQFSQTDRLLLKTKLAILPRGSLLPEAALGLAEPIMPTLPDYPRVSRMRNESPGLPYGSPNLRDKNHFEPFYILKTLLHCVGSPDWNNFSFSNTFHRFLMHFCISDSPKNICWMRVGPFTWGRRAWVGKKREACGWLCEVGKGHWFAWQKYPDFRSLEVSISASRTNILHLQIDHNPVSYFWQKVSALRLLHWMTWKCSNKKGKSWNIIKSICHCKTGRLHHRELLTPNMINWSF